MNLREKRLEEYTTSQLFPINFIDENNKKRLSLSLNLFKICKNFPKDEIGKMKKIQKSLDQNNVSVCLFNKCWESLSLTEQQEVKKTLNKRAATPARTSSYIKFIVKSFIQTYDSNIKVASFKQEIFENWVFNRDGVPYDVTIKKDKLSLTNCIYIDPEMVLDGNRLIKKDFLHQLAECLLGSYNQARVDEMSGCLNKIINNYNILYNQERSVINIHLKEEKDKLVFGR